MAVVFVATFQVKPDRFEDELADVRRSKAVFERCGGKNIRLLTALVAGEATGSMTMTIEADDFAASGAVLDKFFADPEGAAMGAAIGTSASPITPPQSTLWVDVPL